MAERLAGGREADFGMMQARGANGKRDWCRSVTGVDMTDPDVRRRWLVETSLHGPEFMTDGSFPVADGSPRRTWYAEVTVRRGVVVRAR